METTETDKIAEALKLLEEAAKDKKAELRNLVADKFTHLKSALMGAEQSAADALTAAKERELAALLRAKEVSAAKVREAACAVDGRVHANPWPFIGGTAIVALLAGYILGHKR